MKTVKDILKIKSTHVWSITPQASVYEALKLMGDKEVGALLVVDDAGRLVGIMTERDYARKVTLGGKSSKETCVEEIMTPAADMHTVKPENSIEECMALITDKGVRHLPVLDQDALAGLVSIRDVTDKSIIAEKEAMIEHLHNYIKGKYV